MANRKGAGATGATDDEGVIVDPSPADELAEVLAELGQGEGGKVKIERKRAADSRFEFVRRIDASAFTLEWLQDEYGGGEYRLTVTDGQSKYRGSKTLLIAQPLPSSRPATATDSPALEKLAAAVVKQGELLGMFLLHGAAPGVTAPAPADPDAIRRALLSDMVQMKTLFGGGGMDSGKVLEVLKTGIEIAKDAGGGDADGWAGPIERAIEVLGPSFANALDTANAAARAGKPGARPLAGPAAPAVSARPKPQEGQAMQLQKWVGYLVERAAAGSDPEVYAEVILDNVSEVVLRPVLAGGVDALLPRLVGFDARVNEHVQWFRDLGQALTEALAVDVAPPGSAHENSDTGAAP